MIKDMMIRRRPSGPGLFERFDELAESMLEALRPWSPSSTPEPSMLPDFPAWRSDLRVQETPKEVLVFANVPGVEKKDIRIETTEDALTISAERRLERDAKGVREEGYSAFRQSVRLPAPVKPAEAKATLKEGLLKVALPKQRETTTHRVEIK